MSTGKARSEKVPFEERTIVGLVEPITIKQDNEEHELLARIDTGATKSSIDISLASHLKLGPVVASKVIKSANGAKLRPVIEVNVDVHGRDVTAKFTLADRSNMQYKVLIGQNVLRRGFLIDPNKE